MTAPAHSSRRLRIGAVGLVTAACTALAACGSSSTKPPAGFTSHGFSTVASSTTIKPGTATTLHSGDLTVVVPANAVPTTARFDLLTGSNSYWQTYAPAGQKVLSSFAFRVTDTATNHLIVQFGAPVVVKLTNPAIQAASMYLNTTPTSPPKVIPNPKPPVIVKSTLAHGNIADPVGWLITSPGA